VKFFHPLCSEKGCDGEIVSHQSESEAIVKEQNLMNEIGMLESHLNDEVISKLDNGTRRVEWL
jgi:hypothetical protein